MDRQTLAYWDKKGVKMKYEYIFLYKTNNKSVMTDIIGVDG